MCCDKKKKVNDTIKYCVASSLRLMLQDPLNLNWFSTFRLLLKFQIVLPPKEWLIRSILEEHSTTHRIHNNSSHKEHSIRLRNYHDTFLIVIKDVYYKVQPQTLTNSKFSRFAQECTKIFKKCSKNVNMYSLSVHLFLPKR